MSLFDDTFNKYMEILEERVVKLRDIDPKTGKVKWRFRTDKKGYRVTTDPKTGMKSELKQSTQEKRKRSEAAKKTAKRRKMRPKGFKKKTPSWLKQKRSVLIKK